jgi:ornithine--oxo-acid transaminase
VRAQVGYTVKKIPDGQAQIIVCAGNFHGRTSTIVGFSSERSTASASGPSRRLRAVPFGDARALEAAITPNTAAFLVEPVQGEAGIVVPPEGYLTEAARICRATTCCSSWTRCRRAWAHRQGARHPPRGREARRHHPRQGAGRRLLPVSAFCAQESVMGVFKPGDHGSTFGGNALGAAVGLASPSTCCSRRSSPSARHDGRATCSSA